MKKRTYNGTFAARMPKTLIDMIQETSDRLMQSCAEYVRKAIIAQLAKDGVKITESK
jgi:hypothetical protein